MSKLVRYILLFCLFILGNQFVFADTNLKLIFALDLVRHGDRAPFKYMPKISNAWTKKEIGKLTTLGKTQAKLLGEDFREYYINQKHLLPKKFQSDLIYVRSTDYQRTKETAKSILNGMYPINPDKVNIIVPSDEQDILSFANNKKDKILMGKTVLKDISISNKLLVLDIEQQLTDINYIFGTKLKEFYSIFQVADLLRVSKIHNKPLVKHLSKRIKKHAVSLGDELALKFLVHPRIACIYAKDFTVHIADLLQSKHKQKYLLHVAHNTNIATIVTLLGFNLKQRLPYLTDLRFEVFQDIRDKKLFVKTSLNGQNIKLCKSPNYCPLKEFVKVLKGNVQNKCSASSK